MASKRLEHCYIPAGCLLIQQADTRVPCEIWSLPDFNQWHQIIPGLAPDPELVQDGPVLPSEIQLPLLASADISPYAELLSNQWVRFTFSVSLDDPDQGIIRVHLLPDDVGRGAIARVDPGLRKTRRHLLHRLDFSKSTWHGEAGTSRSPSPVFFDGGREKNDDDQSLLQVFNNIPPPDPHPELIRDPDARDFAYSLIDSDVPGLETTLYPYQRRSAALMLQREAQPERVLDPRLVKVVDQMGNPWYYDAISGTGLIEPRYYDGACGGILAEEMGSGKTLICLALILATRHQTSRIPETHDATYVMKKTKTRSLADMAAACITRNAVPWKRWLGHGEGGDGAIEYTKCIAAIRKNPARYALPWAAPRSRRPRWPSSPASPVKIYLGHGSLIIVPPNLVQQWKQEISKHTRGLKVLVYVAQSELPPVKELLEYDIILFSSTRFERLRIDTDRNGPFPESPLARIRFKRCIVDEGHKLGNSTASNKSNLHLMVDRLQIAARWIVTGTPSKGLFGVDESPTSSTPSTPDGANRSRRLVESSSEQERDDLRRIGSIATFYLKARPWANTMAELGDTLADWSVYVMQPKHSPRSSGRQDCLKATLESLIIRHPISDISQLLPVVSEKVVFLDGSYQDKLSLNLFSMIIIFNAVQSQRKDQDYFFHHRQRGALMQLVWNLRQASFFGGWFFSPSGINKAVEMAENFLVEGTAQINAEDEAILRQAIAFGRLATKNSLRSYADMLFAEVPIYVKNFPGGLGKDWSLDRKEGDPVCMDSPLVVALQKYLRPTVDAPNSLQLLFTSGKFEKQGRDAVETQILDINTGAQGNGNPASTLAGNAQLRQDINNLGKRRSASLGTLGKMDQIPPIEGLSEPEIAEPLAETQIISTVSAKLSYLVDQIAKHQANEQIIIFYESENVAWSIAGMLEVLQIHHLIYAKSLTTERRAQYIVTFNHNPKFRVLLMDISQAAFGLDMRSASRIYFINPVLNPQIEAQAIGRARRISQKKPVTVETLVLRGSLEEMIVKRRREMTQAEQRKCKSILDDRPIYDWILNARIIPLPDEEIDGPGQTAMLKTPQFVFGRGFGRGVAHPDEDLVAMPESPKVAIPHMAVAAAAAAANAAESAKAVLDTIVVREKGALVTVEPSRKRRLESESGPSPPDGSSATRDSTPSRPSRRVRFGPDDDD